MPRNPLKVFSNPAEKSLCLIAIAALGLSLAAPAAAQQTPAEFHFKERTLNDPTSNAEPGDIRAYKNALDRYPDAAACPLSGPVTDPSTTIDLNTLPDTITLEVCAFRIAEALANATQVGDFLVRSGFKRYDLIPDTYSKWDVSENDPIEEGRIIDEERINVSASMPGDDIPANFLWLIERFFLRPYGMTINVEMSIDGKPISVDVGMTRL